jgi:hypothetical protein
MSTGLVVYHRVNVALVLAFIPFFGIFQWDILSARIGSSSLCMWFPFLWFCPMKLSDLIILSDEVEIY